MELKFSRPDPSSPAHTFAQIWDTFATSQPALMDPLDRRNAYVKASAIAADEGLFAKRSIPPNSHVATYAGFYVFLETIAPSNWTEEKRANLVVLNQQLAINLPPPHDQLAVYRASLGHKVTTM